MTISLKKAITQYRPASVGMCIGWRQFDSWLVQVTFVVIDHEILPMVMRTVSFPWHVHKWLAAPCENEEICYQLAQGRCGDWAVLWWLQRGSALIRRVNNKHIQHSAIKHSLFLFPSSEAIYLTFTPWTILLTKLKHGVRIDRLLCKCLDVSYF